MLIKSVLFSKSETLRLTSKFSTPPYVRLALFQFCDTLSRFMPDAMLVWWACLKEWEGALS